MAKKEDLSRPVDAYKAIIDQLVNETSYGLSESFVRRQGIFLRGPDNEAHNSFVQSLPIEQREMLAEMLHAERTAAIHDVLAVFSWWIEVGGLSLMFHGQSMPVALSGMGLHGDYVGRQHEWEWPNSDVVES